MRFIFVFLFLASIHSQSALSQTVSIEVSKTMSLAHKLSQGLSEENPMRYTGAVLSPEGKLFGITSSGETIQTHLLRNQTESIPVSKSGFQQAAPILLANPSESSILAIIPKLFTDPSAAPLGAIRNIDSDGIVSDLYQTKSGWIRSADVSEEGQLIALVIAEASNQNESEDRVQVIDRFGNELGEFSLGMETRGVTFTRSLSHVVLYSQNRIGVYDLQSGERVAGTSIRSGIQYATYIPEDQTILAVGAETVTLVHVEKREIATVDIPKAGQLTAQENAVTQSGSLYQVDRDEYLSDLFIPILEPTRFKRAIEGQYEISGFFGRKLQISSRF